MTARVYVLPPWSGWSRTDGGATAAIDNQYPHTILASMTARRAPELDPAQAGPGRSPQCARRRSTRAITSCGNRALITPGTVRQETHPGRFGPGASGLFGRNDAPGLRAEEMGRRPAHARCRDLRRAEMIATKDSHIEWLARRRWPRPPSLSAASGSDNEIELIAGADAARSPPASTYLGSGSARSPAA
jgi:hypothetical protein